MNVNKIGYIQNNHMERHVIQNLHTKHDAWSFYAVNKNLKCLYYAKC